MSLPIGAKMLGGVASGCKAAEAEIGNGDVRVVTIAYDPETGAIDMASSHGKESTTAVLVIALQRFAGLEVRKTWARKTPWRQKLRDLESKT